MGFFVCFSRGFVAAREEGCGFSCGFSQTMTILGFCKLRGTHGGAAPYWDPARRAAATGATPVAGATHAGARAGKGERRPVGAATHTAQTNGHVPVQNGHMHTEIEPEPKPKYGF